MKSIKYLIILILVIGCSEDYLIEKPPHIVTTGNIYSSYEGFLTGLNGLYHLIRAERAGNSGGLYSNAGLRAAIYYSGTDNMTSGVRTGFGSVVEDWENRNVSNNGFFLEIFSWLYKIVNSANTIISEAENRNDIDWTGGSGDIETNKNLIIAEAKALRAHAYRHLSYLWGDVPLNLESADGGNIKTNWGREPRDKVREQIKKDLLFAEKYLPIEPVQQGKITKGAVQHYLSELYLSTNRPDSALYWANKCINTPNYKLITERYGVKKSEEGIPFMDLFYEGNTLRNEGNTESLWSFEYEYGTAGGAHSIMRRWATNRYDKIILDGVSPLKLTVERGGRGICRIAITKYALDVYEKDDDRYSNFAIRKYFVLKDENQNIPSYSDNLPSGYKIGDTLFLDQEEDVTTENSGTKFNWPFTRKFEYGRADNISNSGQYNDQVYLRLAETYLLKAEAQYYLGDKEGSAETINIIRNRSNASEVNSDQIDLDFILDERSRELLYEEHRRYTLLRTGKWLERVQKYNKNGGVTASNRDTLFPIPQLVIDANLTGGMNQNPGFN